MLCMCALLTTFLGLVLIVTKVADRDSCFCNVFGRPTVMTLPPSSSRPSRDGLCVPWKGIVGILVIAVLMMASNAQNLYDWMPYDAFDEIDDRMQAITPQNCKGKPASELRLPADAVGQLPRYNRLLNFIVYPNRTRLLQVHNAALTKAFFFRSGKFNC